jgi:hypothetical protein
VRDEWEGIVVRDHMKGELEGLGRVRNECEKISVKGDCEEISVRRSV